MKTKIKNNIKSLTIIALAILVSISTASAIGTLSPSGTAGDDTQYTLNDIYNKLTTGATSTIGTGTMSVPGSVSASFRTLTEIYNSIPALLSLSASTTTVPVGINIATTTLETIDTDLTASNIKSGTTIFGVEGSYTAAPATLTWSTNQGTMNWDAAVAACAGTVDGSTGWRLPTISELLAGISDDWIIEGDNEDDRFANDTVYWSGSPGGSDDAWFAGWFDDVQATTAAIRVIAAMFVVSASISATLFPLFLFQNTIVFW